MEDEQERKKSRQRVGDLVLHEDGSIERVPPGQRTFNGHVSANPEFVDGVASNDVILDKELGVWVRVYRPQCSQESKLPVVIYYHGGGYVYASAGHPIFHGFCVRLSKRLGAVVVSVNYRLAPEHRLPAAYEDGYSVLELITKSSKQQEQQLDLFAPANVDFSKIFIVGDSAGGNLAAYVALRAAKEGFQLAGQILLQPYFGGIARTSSEHKNESGPVITLRDTDFLWRAALPEGADRDHPYCNPAVSLPGDLAKLKPGSVPRALVFSGGRDLLHDRQVEFAKILEGAGVAVKLIDYENAQHGFYLEAGNADASLAMDEVTNFVKDC